MDTFVSRLSDDFSPKLSEDLLRCGTTKSFAVNEHVFFEGENASFLPIVLKGKVKMVRYPEAGKEIILGTFQAGEIFAIPPALDGKRFPASAVVMEESEVLLLPRDDFLALMGTSSEFSSIVMGRMCGILRDRADTVQILATPSAEHRVASVLLRIGGEIENNVIKRVPYRRQDIAEMSGLSLETTIRVIRKLADKGYFKIVRGRILLETTDHLRNFVR